MSYYELNSHVLNNPKFNKINIAYASYSVAQNNDADRLKHLYKDALILAKKDGFDVFNLTEVMQHKKVLEELMFKVGDGKLHHYLYNWRVPAVHPEDIGIVMLGVPLGQPAFVKAHAGKRMQKENAQLPRFSDVQ